MRQQNGTEGVRETREVEMGETAEWDRGGQRETREVEMGETAEWVLLFPCNSRVTG